MKTLTSKPRILPLTASVLNMHSDAAHDVRLQTLYKMRANAEKAKLRSYTVEKVGDDAMMDAFVKSAHALQVLERVEVCGSGPGP
jgi:amyloid beta precursor protein binding protein 1